MMRAKDFHIGQRVKLSPAGLRQFGDSVNARLFSGGRVVKVQRDNCLLVLLDGNKTPGKFAAMFWAPAQAHSIPRGTGEG
jgi:hypothetical protein